MQLSRTGKTILSVCALLGAASASANQAPTLAPLNDIAVFVGEQVSQRIVPEDADGPVPSLRIIDIPAGAMFSDNGDGTRTFKWVPGINDVGASKITFEVIDAQDQNLRNGRSMIINVMQNGQQTNQQSGNRPPEFESLINRELSLSLIHI